LSRFCTLFLGCESIFQWIQSVASRGATEPRRVRPCRVGTIRGTICERSAQDLRTSRARARLELHTLSACFLPFFRSARPDACAARVQRPRLHHSIHDSMKNSWMSASSARLQVHAAGATPDAGALRLGSGLVMGGNRRIRTGAERPSRRLGAASLSIRPQPPVARCSLASNGTRAQHSPFPATTKCANGAPVLHH